MHQKICHYWYFLDKGLKYEPYFCNDCRDLMQKPINFFKNMVFPKKLHWNMIFLVLSRTIIFLFPKYMILFFRLKGKDYFSQKNTWKYIFFKCPEKMVFP